ncbi:hypothetical protein MHYP_G00100050 [Metynnis hypsauchen]
MKPEDRKQQLGPAIGSLPKTQTGEAQKPNTAFTAALSHLCCDVLTVQGLQSVQEATPSSRISAVSVPPALPSAGHEQHGADTRHAAPQHPEQSFPAPACVSQRGVRFTSLEVMGSSGTRIRETETSARRRGNYRKRESPNSALPPAESSTTRVSQTNGAKVGLSAH